MFSLIYLNDYDEIIPFSLPLVERYLMLEVTIGQKDNDKVHRVIEKITNCNNTKDSFDV